MSDLGSIESLVPDFHRRFLDESADGVLFSDVEGRIRYWNAGATRIFGFDAAEAIGQSLDIIIPEAQRARHWQGYDQTMATGETRYGMGDLLATPALRKDGSRISIEFSIIPLRGAGGKMLGVGAIMRDVSKRFEEMKALRKAAQGR